MEPATTDHQEPAPPANPNKRFRKDKPWDNDTIDHWYVEPVDANDKALPAPIVESSFATLFPKYREAYIRQVWPQVVQTLDRYGLKGDLDLVQGSMTVLTTRKTWDPYSLLKARDLIKLLARSVPLPQAAKIMQDDVHCDVIKIGIFTRNKEKFIKRRQRLIGPEGATLKAIELLTKCYVLVQGNTVCAMGSVKGLKQVRRLVEDCMRNVHPIYNIKTLMIKRELETDPALSTENWQRFLPSFKKKNVKRAKKPIVKKTPTPFPPPQLPRKIDLQMESGEYFLTRNEKAKRAQANKQAETDAHKQERAAQRASEFEAPQERARDPTAAAQESDEQRIERLKRKFKQDGEQRAKRGARLAADDYVAAPSKKKPKNRS